MTTEAIAQPATITSVEQLPNLNDAPGQYLSFTLGEDLYAIGILHVKEIIEYMDITPVPMTQPFIKGVFNLRGNVLPVIDLACRLELPSADVGKRTCIITVELQNGGEDEETVDIGIIVDSVNDVLSFENQELATAPAFGSHIRSEFIDSIAKLKGRFIVVLNVNKVLDLKELAGIGRA